MYLSRILHRDDSPPHAVDYNGSRLFDPDSSDPSEDLDFEKWLEKFISESVTDDVSAGNHSVTAGVVDNTLSSIQPGLTNWALTVTDNRSDVIQSHEPTSADISATSCSPAENSTVAANDFSNDIRVCYGMIYNIDVKLVGDMTSLIARLNRPGEASPSRIQTFTLSPRHGHVLLLLPNGTEFGHPRGDITDVLSPLLGWNSLEFEAVALANTICRKIHRVNKEGEAIVQVDVNIYGPSSQGTTVGDKLTTNKVWLQRPDYYKKQFEYVNPHVIRFPELEGSAQLEELGNEALQLEQRIDVDVMQMVSEVQQSTHRAAGLERVMGDQRLHTKLLEHQERGLAFMLERESGQVPEEFRLWEPCVIEGSEMFLHRITKTRSAIRPDEKGGGVLADEMGMGKTLSILALIIKTMEESYEWAEKSTDEEISHSETQHYAHSTLIIVPSGLIINSWVSEVSIHLGDAVRVIKYHGDRRERDIKALAGADIVLTTYKTLATDYFSKKRPQSILHSMGWFRVVLDEAHNIRRPATSFHRACAALTARSRWCLTGTPIQNKLEDIGALFVFLRAEPFQSMARFRWYLVSPFEQQDPVAKERLVMLFDSLVLRRTKDILDLPGQEERVRELHLSTPEQNQYDMTTSILSRYIRQQDNEHEINKISFGLFQATLQLRLLCNHGTHQKLFSWKRKSRSIADAKEAFLAELGLDAERVCAGCDQPRPIINSNNSRGDFVGRCAHIFCRDCWDSLDAIQAATSPLRHCPLCEPGVGDPNKDGDLPMRDADEIDADEGVHFNLGGYSTKMTALITDVKETLSESVVTEDGRTRKTKSIIFSCWTRTLDLVEVYLKREQIEFLRVDGECLMSKRQRILDRFSQPNGPRIMLMTTGTGAFGLNLTAANRIFITELQWNPSVENQAIARAIRLRQSDKVIVTRYMMMGTVEQEMKSQQVKKKRAAKAGFGRSRD